MASSVAMVASWQAAGICASVSGVWCPPALLATSYSKRPSRARIFVEGAAGGGSKPGMAGDVRAYQSNAAAPAARHSPGVAASQIKRLRFTAGMILLGRLYSLRSVCGSPTQSTISAFAEMDYSSSVFGRARRLQFGKEQYGETIIGSHPG